MTKPDKKYIEWAHEGRPAEEIINQALQLKSLDIAYDSGRIFNSFCSAPHPFATKLYQMFMHTNLTKGFIKSVRYMEKEVIELIGQMFQGSGRATGYMTSGGTEANIVAFWAAKSLHPERNVILATAHTHYSIEKIRRLMGLEVRHVPVRNHRMDARMLEDYISPQTLGIHATAISPDIGAMDPIADIAGIAYKHGIHLHVDAAYGGYILPFLEATGRPPPEFDFSLNGVSSISVDPHKLGLVPLPAGAILFANQHLMDAVTFDVQFPPITSNTLLGSRPGAPIAATWGLMQLMGRSGYIRMVEKVMRHTDLLLDSLRQMPEIRLTLEPEVNIVCFEHARGPQQTTTLVDKIKSFGFLVEKNTDPLCIRVVLGPHLEKGHVLKLIECLQAILHDFPSAN